MKLTHSPATTSSKRNFNSRGAEIDTSEFSEGLRAHANTRPWEYLSIGQELRVFFAEDTLFRDILHSKAFRRLKDVKFLGAIDYLIRPTGGFSKVYRHTRQQHTLGVARLALSYLKNRTLSCADNRLVMTAALLHDIGHAPLSHSLEPCFRKHFGIDHHLAGVAIIRDNAPRGLGSEIHKALRIHNIDIDKLIALIGGKLESETFNVLFAHPINIDTIEAISRCKNYLDNQNNSQSPAAILESMNDPFLKGANIDDFWHLKDAVYNIFINGPLGILADKLAIEYMESNIKMFARVDFFRSERSLRRSHPALFATFEHQRVRLIQTLLRTQEEPSWITHFSKRRFHILPDFPSGDPRRYAQSKSHAALSFSKLESHAKAEMAQLETFLSFL